MKADVAFSKVGAIVSASSLLLATAVFRYGPGGLWRRLALCAAHESRRATGQCRRPAGARAGEQGTRPTLQARINARPVSRLADLVPPPRKHRHRYHGVFAPSHKLRRAVTTLAKREHRHATRRRDRRACGQYSCRRRLLRHSGKAPLARHLTDCVGEADGPGGGGVSARVPELRRRYPTQRRRPAGAGSLGTGGSQAGEGQDGFARVKSAPHTPWRTARAAARLAGPGPTHRLGRARAGP